MTSQDTILIVEDDAVLARGMAALLERAGFAPLVARDGGTALDTFTQRCGARSQQPISLIILDLKLPDLDGLDVLRSLRLQRPEMPVLVLSAKGTVVDKVTLLDAGADDYMVKPFQVDELLARIRVLLKRWRATEPDTVRLGDVEIDLERRSVLRKGVAVTVSSTELAILETLIRRPGAVVSRDEIVDRVWGLDPPETPRAVDYHILQLRRKLEADPKAPRLIVTERGIGYRLRISQVVP